MVYQTEQEWDDDAFDQGFEEEHDPFNIDAPVSVIQAHMTDHRSITTDRRMATRPGPPRDQ